MKSAPLGVLRFWIIARLHALRPGRHIDDGPNQVNRLVSQLQFASGVHGKEAWPASAGAAFGRLNGIVHGIADFDKSSTNGHDDCGR